MAGAPSGASEATEVTLATAEYAFRAEEPTPAATRQFDVLLFDLDGTLYSADCGYVAHQRNNMFTYIQEKGWVPQGQTPEEYWRPLFQKYNQSLRGWKAMGHITTQEQCDEYVSARARVCVCVCGVCVCGVCVSLSLCLSHSY